MKLRMRYNILYVTDLEKSLTFYRDLLGIPIKAQHGTYTELDTGATILALNTRESVRELTNLPVPDKVSSSQTFELGFVVEDVIGIVEHLRENGVSVLLEPIIKPWGQTVAYVADPDGHFIELCSSLD